MAERPPLSAFLRKQKEEEVDVKVLRGKQGDKGDSPTKEELVSLITPLIPEPKDGKTPSKQELLSLIKPLIPDPIKGDDGITPSLEELEAIVLSLIPEVEIPELAPKDLIEKINKAKTAKISRARVEGMDELEGLAKSANKNVQNILSLGGSRQTIIKNNGSLTGTGVTTINFTGGTVTKVGNGEEITVPLGGTGGGQVNSVVAGTNVTVDSTDPANPIVSSTGGGSPSIGGTITSGTTGSILFVNPTATIAQDNANFFWDETNKRLGIGTSTPVSNLDILGSFPGFKVRNTSTAQFSGAGFFLSNTASTMGNEAGVTFYAGINDVSATKGFFSIDKTNVAGGGTGHLVLFDLDANTTTLSNLTSNGIVTTSGGTGLLSVTGTTGSGNVVLATSPTLVTPVLGTPASGVATNLTGTAAGLTAGTVTTNANLTGPITSVGNATTITNSVNLPASPTTTTQAPGDNSTKIATTAYVAAALLGQDFKEAAKYATTGALPAILYANGSSGVGATLTGVSVGALAVDSASPSVNDRILVKNQVSTFQNGIYTVTATGSGIAVFVLTRSTDFNQSFEIDAGDSVFVTSGTLNSTTTWAYNAGDAPTIGTDPITFAQTAGQGSFTAGNGIAITGTSIAIDTSVTVDKTTAQTLTNKTLTSPLITGGGAGVGTLSYNTSANSTTLVFPSQNGGSIILVGQTTVDTLTNKTLTTPIITSISNSGTITIPTGTDTLVARATTDTLTNKRITNRVVVAADATSITPNSDNADITQQTNTQAGGTLTINADGGTPTNGQGWILKIKSTNVQTFAWNGVFVGGTTALPTATTGSGKIDYFPFIYDTLNSKWDYVQGNAGF